MATPHAFSKVLFAKTFTPGFSVISAEVEDHDRMIDKAQVVIDDPRGTAASIAQPGTEIQLELGWEEENAILFHGLVEATSSCASNGGGTTTVTAYDHGILMHKRRWSEAYEGKLDDVVQKVLLRYRPLTVRKVSANPNPTFVRTRQLVQSSVTDYEFLNQLAVHYGARSFVEYDPDEQEPSYYFVDNQTLFDADPIGSLEYCCGYSKLLDFSYERGVGHPSTQMTSNVIDPVTGSSTEVVGPAPPNPPPPSAPPGDAAATGDGATADAVAAAVATAGEQAAQPPVTDAPRARPADPERDRLIAMHDPTRVLGWRGQGRAVGTVKLRAKSKVTIHGIAPWAEGDWYINRAVHKYNRGGPSGPTTSASYETSFSVTR